MFFFLWFFQIYDRKLRQYQQSLEDIDAGLVQSLCNRTRLGGGAERVKTELDHLNKHFMDMVAWTNARLKDITSILSEANIDIKVSKPVSDLAVLKLSQAPESYNKLAGT